MSAESEIIGVASKLDSNASFVLLSLILIVQVLRITFDFVTKYKETKNPQMSHNDIYSTLGGVEQTLAVLREDSQGTKANVTWLKDVHDKQDEDGVMVWYTRKSLERSIDKLSDNIKSNTDALNKFLQFMEYEAKVQKR